MSVHRSRPKRDQMQTEPSAKRRLGRLRLVQAPSAVFGRALVGAERARQRVGKTVSRTLLRPNLRIKSASPVRPVSMQPKRAPLQIRQIKKLKRKFKDVR